MAIHALVQLDLLRDRGFAVGSLLSFVCGIGLFGSVYLMPVFLGLVRNLGAFDTGKVMLVTGLAQLATAPVAVALERRIDARWLALFGFATFAVGCAMSTAQTVETDFNGMLWPQIVRGISVMFCLLAPTRLALGHLPPERIPDASGLFNLMRNLGGAIGLALIDTIIYGRVAMHGRDLVGRLTSGDLEAARIVGLPLEMFIAQAGRPPDAATQAILGPMIERAALSAVPRRSLGPGRLGERGRARFPLRCYDAGGLPARRERFCRAASPERLYHCSVHSRRFSDRSSNRNLRRARCLSVRRDF